MVERLYNKAAAHLDLGEESAVGRNTISTVLDGVQRVFPVHLIVLHHVHDDEGR